MLRYRITDCVYSQMTNKKLNWSGTIYTRWKESENIVNHTNLIYITGWISTENIGNIDFGNLLKPIQNVDYMSHYIYNKLFIISYIIPFRNKNILKNKYMMWSFHIQHRNFKFIIYFLLNTELFVYNFQISIYILKLIYII